MRNIVKILDAPSESGTRQSPHLTLCPASRHGLRDTPEISVTSAGGIAVRSASDAVTRTNFLNCKNDSAAHPPIATAPTVRGIGATSTSEWRRWLQSADLNLSSSSRRGSLWSRLLAVLTLLTLIASHTARAIQPLQIVTQPQSQTTTVGSEVTFSVAATDSNLDYQWLFNGTALPRATNSSYTLETVQSTNAGNYQVVVSSSTDQILSAVATLTVSQVNQSPRFVSTPKNIAYLSQVYSYTMEVSDPDPSDNLQLKALQFPSWLTFNASTRTLSGTPPPGGPPDGEPVTLLLNDGVNPTVIQWFKIWTEDMIRLESATDVESKRQELIQNVWGADGWPRNRNFSAIQTNISDPLYSGIYGAAGNLDRIDLYTVTMDYGLESHVHHFHPVRGNGRLFVFHAGHEWGGFREDDVQLDNDGINPGLVIPALLKEGFSVLSFDMPVFNPYGFPTVTLTPGGDTRSLRSHDDMFAQLDRPFRFFLEPIAVALNYIEDHYAYEAINMTGVSGGGWTTTIYSAIDPRISRGYPVAGSTPIYLRVGYEGLGDAEQVEPEFYNIANYEELYVMGSHGPNRLQLQVLNLYDACCFSGTRFTNWVAKVRLKTEELGAGSYDFFSDTTHQSHKTSPAALAVILDSLPPTFHAVSDMTTYGNSGPQTVALSGIVPATLTRTNLLTFSVVTDNPLLFDRLDIDYTSPDSTGTLNFTTATNAHGTAMVTVTLSDGRSAHSSYSRQFQLNVSPPSTPPIVQWLSPTNGTILQSPQALTLNASATVGFGTIARVEFRDGTNSLGVITSPPYSLLWNNPTVGSHTLSALATDDRGGVTTSDSALLTVLPLNQAPTVQWLNPATNTVLQNPQHVLIEVAAGDLDGTIAQVEFRDGTNSLGVLGNPPYTLVLTNATVGTHFLSAVATDNRGATTTSDVALLTVLPLNQAPSVQWLSPANNSVLQNPQSVTLQVTPSDFDGTIARVEFREGTKTLGAVSSPPYSVLWTNPTAGTHTLSAVVTDNRGGATLSDLINVTITPPSTNEIPLTIRSAQFVAFQGSPVTKSALDPANSQFQFQIVGPDGSTVVVEISSDLRNWAPISTNTLVNGAALSTDTESWRFENRHYRVRLSTPTP